MKVYTAFEVALKLKCSVKTVYRLISSGKLQVVRVGRAVRIPEGGLREYLGLPARDSGQPGA